MTEEVESRNVVITGASSGIGAATARRLADAGHRLLLVGRRADRLAGISQQLRAAGADVMAVAADLTAEEGLQQVADAVSGPFGSVDVLINNAGSMSLATVEDAGVVEWDSMIDTNFRAVIRLTRLLLPPMLNMGRLADIVMVSSLSANNPLPGRSVYAASKAAVSTFAEGLRRETAGTSVRVAVVEPGLVATDLRRDIEPATISHLQAGHDPATPLQPDDVAAVIQFVLDRPRSVAIGSILIRPVGQTD